MEHTSVRGFVGEQTEHIIERVVDDAVADLKTNMSPDGSALGKRFRLALIDRLVDEDIKLAQYPGQTASEQKRYLTAVLRSEMVSFALPVTLRHSIAPTRAILLTVTFVVLGILLVSPALRWTTGSADLGLLTGALLGAPLAVYLTARPELLGKARWILIGALGAAVVTQILASPLQAVGTIWARIIRNRQQSLGSRILLIGAVLLLILLARSEEAIDESATLAVAKTIGTIWLTSALQLLSASHHETAAHAEDSLLPLVGQCYRLHQTTAEDLTLAVQELLQTASAAGFSGLDGPAAFFQETSFEETLVWSEALEPQYQTFGYVEPGDRVQIMSRPIVRGETVQTRGTVRKVRIR